jgi:two-component system nitrogen regulation response regulator GlnG
MVKAKTFREDLYYRLNVVRIRMPALRDREDDIPQIVDFCVQNLAKTKKSRVTKVSPEALQVLTQYRWPGNVRELENVIYRSAVIAQGDTILLKDLPSEIRSSIAGPVPQPGDIVEAPIEAMRTSLDESSAVISARAHAAQVIASAESPLTVASALDFLHRELSGGPEPILSVLEREMIQRVVKAEEGNLLKASEKLGITRATLRKRVDELGLRS